MDDVPLSPGLRKAARSVKLWKKTWEKSRKGGIKALVDQASVSIAER
jgi:hypothetical protein